MARRRKPPGSSIPQVIIPPPAPVSTQSGGTSGDLTVKGYKNETPIVPYSPGQVGTPAPTAHAVAVAAAAEQEHNAEAAAAQAAAKAARHLARTRQKQLVSTYVTKAYKNTLKKQGTPQAEINRRVKSAKDQLAQDRKRLLSHPAVKSANAEGKVIGFKGLQKVKRTEAPKASSTKDLFALPGSLSHSKEHGLEVHGLALSKKELERVQRANPVQGTVGRGMAKAEEARRAADDPSTLEVLGYASLGIPGIGVGGAVAKGLELGAETVPKLLVAGGAKEVAKDVGRSVVGKAGAKAAAIRAIPQTAKGLPKALRAGSKDVPGLAKAAGRAAPKYAAKKGARTGEKSLQAFSGLGLLGAVKQTGLNVPGGAIIEGQGRALQKDPGKVFGATANIFPSLLTSTMQFPVAAVKSGLEGNTAPLEGAWNEQVEFANHFIDTYGSDDPKVIEKAALEEGLLPEILLYPFTRKFGGKASGPLRAKIRERVEAKRAPAMDEDGNVLLTDRGAPVKKGRQPYPSRREEPLTRAGRARQQRHREAIQGSLVDDLSTIDAAQRIQKMQQHVNKAKGERAVVAEGLGPKSNKKLQARSTDYLQFLNRASVDLDNPEAALAEIKHIAEGYKQHKTPAEAGIDPESLTARDAAAHFLAHREELRDPHLKAALDEYRAQANGTNGKRSLSYSDPNRYLGHAVQHGIPLRGDRVPMKAREFTNAKTRKGAFKDLKKRGQLEKKLNKDAKVAWEAAVGEGTHTVDLKDRARLEAEVNRNGTPEQKAKLKEAKDLYAKERAAKKDRKQLGDALKDYQRPLKPQRPGKKPKRNPHAKRKYSDEELDKEFIDEVRASLEAKGLHPEPAYVSDAAALIKAESDAASGDAIEGVPKINEGQMWKEGFSRQGFEHLKSDILRNVHRHHQYENARRWRRESGIEYKGERQYNGRDWGKLAQQGIIDEREVDFVPVQKLNRLENVVEGGEGTDYQNVLLDAQAKMVRNPDELGPGTMYEAFPRASREEFFEQAKGANVNKWLAKVNEIQGKTMLSTPAYLGSQTVAEIMQAIATNNPARLAQGLNAYRKLTPEQQLQISGHAGESPAGIFQPKDVKSALDSYDNKKFKDNLAWYRRYALGRTANSIVWQRWAGDLARKQSAVIRRASLTGEILKDVNGMGAKMRRLAGTQTELQKLLDGKSKDEQIAWVAEHPEYLDKYHDKLIDAMGGWSNLTRTGHFPEAKFSKALVFYSFLRMSLLWPLKYAKNHPIKATALAYLAAENNWALKRALEGDPSFLNFAQIPTWTLGEDGKPVYGDTINLSRMAIGGNVVTQAAQGSGSLLGALNPLAAAALMGATGQGPLGDVGGGTLEHVLAAGASMVGLSPYARGANVLRGQAASGQSEFGVLGKRANLALDPLAALSAKLKGPQGEQLMRSLVNPLTPQDLQLQRDYAKTGRILTKLGDKGSKARDENQVVKGTPEEQRAVRKENEKLIEENKVAEKELEKMYKKYGLDPVAARSTEVFEYTHPYGTEKEKRKESGGGIYGSSESGGSIYDSGSSEGSIYGGGSKEKPVPVPYSDNSAGISLPGLSGPLGAIASPLAALVGGTPAQAAGRQQGPKPAAGDYGAIAAANRSRRVPTKEIQNPDGSFKKLDHKTLGTPSSAELIRAGKEGKLRMVNGKITTPRTRRATKQLVAAQKAAAKSQGDGSVEARIGSHLLRKGLTRVAAAGVIGNAMQESSLIPTADDGAGNGGLLGFTAGEVSKANMQAYAAEKGKNWEDPEVQMDFMLEHVDPGTIEKMNAASSPAEAAVIFQDEFERPGEPMQENREQYASEALGGSWGKPNAQTAARLKRAEQNARKIGIIPSELEPGAPSQIKVKLWGGKRRGKITGDIKGTHPEMLRLGRAISGIAGLGPLNVISGSRPGSVTESGTLDRHSEANALDIGALDHTETAQGGSMKTEREGDRIAMAAAKAVGLDPKSDEVKNWVKNGGYLEQENSPSGYNVELIWKTSMYGNHHNHVHVGIKPNPGALTVESMGTPPQAPKPIPKGERKWFKKTSPDDHLRFVPVFAKQLTKLAKASGEPLVVNDGFRTYDEQVERKAEYGSGAAEPGTSNHEFGTAADLQLSEKQRSLLSKFGLGLPVPGEDWHVELVDSALKAKAEGQAPTPVPGIGGTSYTPSSSGGSYSGGSGVGTAVSTSAPTKGEKKKQQKQSIPLLSGAQKLKLVNEITEGNLEGLGIPGYQPSAGPAVADLAALGKSLEEQRRKLARL